MPPNNFSNYQTDILTRFGLGMSPFGDLLLQDSHRAETCHLHHTFTPIAACAWARTAPSIARSRLGNYRLSTLVAKRPNMSHETAEVFAAVCGVVVQGPFQFHAAQFDRHLRRIIETYELWDFFGDYPSEGDFHEAIRPRGFEWGGSLEPVPGEMAHFRAAYRRLEPLRLMLVASILWLYQGDGDDNAWLNDLPCAWNAIDAVQTLESAGMLKDWAELVARYPGW